MKTQEYNFDEIKNTVIKNWDKIILKTEIEEKSDEILAAVKYDVYGDDYLVIITIDGNAYEYGWYCGLKYGPDYEDIYKFPEAYEYFLRKPLLDKKLQFRCDISNELYWHEKHCLTENDFSNSITIYKNKKDAQDQFDFFLKTVKEVFKESDSIYHYNSDTAKRFLTKNDLLTEENKEKLKLLDKYYRKGEIDGIAGKEECFDDAISGDSLQYVMINPKYSRKKSVRVGNIAANDGWGSVFFKLNLNQFKKLLEEK